MKRVIARLIAAYPHKEISEATAVIYLEDLSRYQPALLEEAIKEIRRRSTFFPSIAEIITEVDAVEKRWEMAAQGLDEETGWKIWRKED